MSELPVKLIEPLSLRSTDLKTLLICWAALSSPTMAANPVLSSLGVSVPSPLASSFLNIASSSSFSFLSEKNIER